MPQVAIITRTMTRPFLLQRALLSVHNQLFTDYIHVIVNDGGDPRHVDEALEVAIKKDPTLERNIKKIKIIHLPQNRGMEAASNIGIRSVDSEFVVIHDDDDSWHPVFLERTVSYLKDAPIKSIGGVITKSLVVWERVEGYLIKYLYTEPFVPRVPAAEEIFNINAYKGIVPADKMLWMNVFPPISFLFKREIYNKIGGYNEELAVLGDWDFHLKFLLFADIGIIPYFYAYYHWRLSKDVNVGNTVTTGKWKHQLYINYLKNQWLRSLPKKESEELTKKIYKLTLVLYGTLIEQQNNRLWELRLQNIKNKVNRLPFYKPLIKYIRKLLD